MEASRLDQIGDVSHTELHRFNKLYGFPDFVKSAASEELTRQQLPISAYADTRGSGQFPCNTKTATYLSWVYFLEKRSELAPKIASFVQNRLEKFADNWGIRPQVQTLQDKHASIYRDTITELPDSAFALVWASDDGKKERHYPLRNALEVKAAAAWFAEHRDGFAFQDRYTIANKILEKAAHFGAHIVEHEELLDRQAGKGLCEPKKVAAAIQNRVRAATIRPELAAGMQKLAAKIVATPQIALDHEALVNVARTVDQFDRIACIKYSELCPRVEDVVFAIPFREMRKLADTACTTTTGSIYGREQFEKLSLEEVRGVFGDDIAEAVAYGLKVDPEKMAEMASTLPRPDAQLLDQLMGETGQAPIAKQAAAREVRYTPSQLKELAEFYTG